ncbi:MAG: M23 family metallopeptidase [Magnetococcus sp. DMHC-1]|nr:M23 family metallopeptidase [Magnetococcales bacterium]
MRTKLFQVVCLLGTLLLRPQSASSQESLLLSSPLQPGMAVLLSVPGFPPGSHFTGSLAGKPFPLTPEGMALLAVDMEAKPGTLLLEVKMQPPTGQAVTLKKNLSLTKRSYKVEKLTLPEKKVDLDPADAARATKESAAIKATYQRRTERVGFTGGFRMPVTGRFSGVFGSRRLLNGQMRSPHNGVDIAAPENTPVVATAPGTVALLGRDYFFTGNTLLLDHGHGVVSLYAHLHDLRVAEGDWLPEGTVLGTVGMTGRATGPHLHWGILVRGERVDPTLLPGIVTQPTP